MDMNDALFALGELYLAKRELEQKVTYLETKVSMTEAGNTQMASDMARLESELEQMTDMHDSLLKKMNAKKKRRK